MESPTSHKSDALLDLNRRASVIDVQHNYALGVDLRDWRLYRSVFDDVVDYDFSSWHGGERRRISADTWVQEVCARQSGFDGTQHQMSNHVVSFDAEGARCLTYIVAHHYLLIDGKHHLQRIGGYYDNRLTLRNTGWKISSCKLNVLWTHGDKALFDIASERWENRGT